MGMSSIPMAFPLARDSKADLTSSFVTCGFVENGGCVYISYGWVMVVQLLHVLSPLFSHLNTFSKYLPSLILNDRHSCSGCTRKSFDGSEHFLAISYFALLFDLLTSSHEVLIHVFMGLLELLILQGKRLEPGEVITSFDVKALFTLGPVQPSIQIVKQRLQQDNTLPQRTSMSISQITSLLEFCLTHTCFLFQGKYYEQVQGTTMGSPISPLIANIFMEKFEVKAFNSFPHPASLWLRFVDDTFVINKAKHSQDLPQHINNQDPHIQFMVKPTQQGSLPFLDTLVTIELDNTFSTTVYRKPTIQINIYIGTATTSSQQNKVSSTPWHTGPKQFLLLKIKWTGNFNTSEQHYNTASFLHGPSISGNTSSPIPTNSPPTPPATTAQQTTTKTRPPL